jgi:HPt (histidine-containing phosphotransfer) domain-containing protein
MTAQLSMAKTGVAPNRAARASIQLDTREAADGTGRSGATVRSPEVRAFDAAEFGELIETIGEDGVAEMLEIFESEMRRRLIRLAAGNQDGATLVREMHTLKGAAGTVAAPRLASLGRTLEQRAQRGIGPVATDLAAIASALEAFLTEVALRSGSRAGI